MTFSILTPWTTFLHDICSNSLIVHLSSLEWKLHGVENLVCFISCCIHSARKRSYTQHIFNMDFLIFSVPFDNSLISLYSLLSKTGSRNNSVEEIGKENILPNFLKNCQNYMSYVIWKLNILTVESLTCCFLAVWPWVSQLLYLSFLMCKAGNNYSYLMEFLW